MDASQKLAGLDRYQRVQSCKVIVVSASLVHLFSKVSFAFDADILLLRAAL